jgi:hypothetical protein
MSIPHLRLSKPRHEGEIMSHTASTPVSAMASTLLPSVLRTTVPIIYALLARKGVVEWLGVEDALLNNLLAGVVTVIFYIGLRVAERYHTQVGWLLGYAQQPVYVKGEVVSVTETPTPPTTTTTVEAVEPPPADEHRVTE